MKGSYIYLRIINIVVFNGTFKNISAISWHSIYFVEDIKVPAEKTKLCK
jgi:hypothetical protein